MHLRLPFEQSIAEFLENIRDSHLHDDVSHEYILGCYAAISMIMCKKGDVEAVKVFKKHEYQLNTHPDDIQEVLLESICYLKEYY